MRNLNDDIKYVSDYFGLNKDVLLYMSNFSELKKYKKKDVFLKTGINSDKFFFIISGALRSYLADENGREFTSAIHMAPTAVAPVKSLTTKSKTVTNYQCLTDCFIYQGSFTKLKKLATNNIEVAKLYSRFLEFSFSKLEDRLFELSTLSTSDKYLKLKERLPDVENLLSQKQIASYLNITPVQLSRIRKKIYSK